MAAMSCASCTELEASSAKPVPRVAITSEWSPKMDEGVGSDRAGGNVKDRRRQFAGDLVHVGDHQQQSLRGRERGGQRPGLQGTMDGAGSAPFGLQFDDGGHRAPTGSCGLALAHSSDSSPMPEEGVIG